MCLLSPTSKGFHGAQGREKTKTYLFQIFCKVKDRTKKVSKSYNHDQEVHMCEYVVDGVKSKRVGCSMILSLPSYILGMANFLIFAWTFMCPFFFMGLHVPSFFSIHSSCPYWREFLGETLWNMEHKRGYE